ncbi:MAG: peptidoglycan-binding protein [Siculibacillus sp.]|nr:peptidoglycan-binding protein [Siculibacillus sp.]
MPVTDRRTVDALEATISRLDELMSRQQAPVPAGMVDGRVAELIARLDRGDVGPASADIDALGRQIAEMHRELTRSRSTVDLEAEMRKLAERLERSAVQEPDDEALAQIEEQLERISRQLEASETRFGGFADVENIIRRLGDRIESQQADTLAAAREAAREMVLELGRGRGDGLGDEALRGLQEDLRSLRSASRDSESRTNDTLISLHDALTGIVGRLTAIEKIAQGSARSTANRPATADTAVAAVTAAAMRAAPAVTAAAPAAPGQSSVATPTTAAAQTVAAAPQPAPGGVASAITRAREALATASSEDTRPLEPGSGKPAPRTATVTPPTATMRPTTITQGEPKPATPVGDAANAANAVARKADFIAAARRAAQAAAAAEAPVAARPEDRTSTQIAAEPEVAGSGALSRIGQVLKNRRRPLVLATGALVLAVMTLRLIPGGGESALQESADAPQVTEHQVAEPKPAATSSAEKRSTENGVAIETPPAAPAAIPAAPAPAHPQTTAAPVSPAPAPTAAAPGTPILTEKPQAAAPVAPGASPLSAEPTQRTSALSRPMPDATLLDAPATTGSIGGDAHAAPETTLLPAKIGSEKLRRAAMTGDPRAAFEVGMRYAEGRGIAADPKEAAEWYAKAADKGLAPAQYRWAVALEKGIGVPRDSEKAKQWYRKAAEAGNVRAMHNLGVLHANARDIGSALPWFQKAADLGLKDSQFNLGIIHALGSGVKQDLAVSYKWFALAARQGDKEADKKMNDVAAHLTKVDLAAARMAVQTWVQKPMDREANEELQVWAEPKDAPRTASANDAETVRKVQGLLKSRGLYGGTVDGQMGSATRGAIMAFQKKVGQAQTGEIDGELVQLLAGKSL